MKYEDIYFMIESGFLKIKEFPRKKGSLGIHMKNKGWYGWRDKSYIMFQCADPEGEIFHFKITSFE